jgi:predicted phage-related endonuclease
MIQQIPIASVEQWLELRKADVTASVVGALRNLHPFTSRLRLYKEKIGVDMGTVKQNVRMRRGSEIEAAIGAMVGRKHRDWKITEPNVYLRDPERRIGATPDFYIESDEELGLGVLQTKLTTEKNFRREWMSDDGTLMVPPWIVLQTTVEAMLAGATFGMVAVLIDDPWNRLEQDLYEFRIERHTKGEERIRQDVAEFWDDVANQREPDVNASLDGELVHMLYQETSELETVDLTGDNYLPGALIERAAAKERIKADQALVDEVDTYILGKMGTAEIAFVNGFTITAKSYTAKPFWNPGGRRRPLRVKDIRPTEIIDDGKPIKF